MPVATRARSQPIRTKAEEVSEEFEKLVEDLLTLTGEDSERKLCLRLGFNPMRLSRWKRGAEMQEALTFFARLVDEYDLEPGKIEAVLRRRLLRKDKR